MSTSPDLRWSASFHAISASRAAAKQLTGDKIILPPSALEQLLSASTQTPDPFRRPYALLEQALDSTPQLPNPLTFRLVNPKNGNSVYAGIREFSADDNEVGISPYLAETLGIEVRDEPASEPTDPSSDSDIPPSPFLTVIAKQLPKGTYVRLRPLEAGYNPDDWKSLLERQLRQSFTTLTRNAVLSVRGVHREEFRFLVDKFLPEGDGICVVDTDLEVDIEALNEEQARETLRQIASRAGQPASEGSSTGGQLDIWKPVEGRVVPGEYVDYTLPSWDRSLPLSISVSGIEEHDGIEVFVSPRSTRLRVPPRETEHVFGDFGPPRRGEKSLRINPDQSRDGDCESLVISVHAHKPQTPPAAFDDSPRQYMLRASALSPDADEQRQQESGPTGTAEEEQCKNCLQWVPRRTMVLHENFCRRNNILCTQCRNVFQKSSPEWQSHWHCPTHPECYGNLQSSKERHDEVLHTEHRCSACEFTAPTLSLLAEHRTTLCPEKLILCRFCHLEVPQEGDPYHPSAESLLTGLSAHELADGGRTTECHLCGSIIRLKDVETHMKHHELDKATRENPPICRNSNCGRTIYGVGPRGAYGPGTISKQAPVNELGLCSACFGPLYASVYDPDGKAMRRRIERRYLSQLITGCNKSWCKNEWCRTGRANTSLEALGTRAQEALPLVKPLVAAIPDHTSPMHFCVDEASQRYRQMSEYLAKEGQFDFEWCIAACEASNGNAQEARAWLENWARRR